MILMIFKGTAAQAMVSMLDAEIPWTAVYGKLNEWNETIAYCDDRYRTKVAFLFHSPEWHVNPKPGSMLFYNANIEERVHKCHLLMDQIKANQDRMNSRYVVSSLDLVDRPRNL